MSRDRHSPLALGIDLGTSGCRVIVIDTQGEPVAETHRAIPESRQVDGLLCQQPAHWWCALCECLRDIARTAELARVESLAVDSTSGTLLLADRHGHPVTLGIMYNDQRPTSIRRRIQTQAGACAAASVSSSLAKLLWLHDAAATDRAHYALHAADWIAGRLCGRFGYSDEHNALKSGFDPLNRQWPHWIQDLGIDMDLLPQVQTPGSRLAPIDPVMVEEFGFSANTFVHSGTTDSVAAFLASGADAPGDAVSVLGSTLVVKVLSTVPVLAPEFGVYSHRVGALWLVGGASNSGGAALARYMPLAEIRALSPRLRPSRAAALDYYPLPATGERFPVADPTMASRVAPIPDDRSAFLHGLLEGVTRIEKQAYDLLAELGATPVQRIFTTGSGVANPAWQAIRERVLGFEFATPDHEQAAYGAARLAAGKTPVLTPPETVTCNGA